jgi:ferredoxin
VHKVRKYGKFDTNACLSCGSCTVVCDLSNGYAAFPHKPIRRVLLGLKRSLRGSPEPWLCHDCSDCSTTCPRQADPRESMTTLRRYLAAQYDVTGLSSKVFTSKAWHIGALTFTTLLVFGLAFFYHLWYVQLTVDELMTIPLGMEHMFDTIVYFTVAVFLIPLLIFTAGVIRMQRWIMRGGTRSTVPLRLYLHQAYTIILHMVSHKNIKKCIQQVRGKRFSKHWLLALAVTAKFIIILFFLKWFQTDSIYSILHPQRWVGYLIFAAMIYVPSEIIIGRIRKRKEIHKTSEFSDYSLPVMLLLVALSGIAIHSARYMGFELTSHFTYAIHISVSVALIVIELPFGKLSHVIYRPFAIYFQSVKERAIREEEPPLEENQDTEIIHKEPQAA